MMNGLNVIVFYKLMIMLGILVSNFRIIFIVLVNCFGSCFMIISVVFIEIGIVMIRVIVEVVSVLMISGNVL